VAPASLSIISLNFCLFFSVLSSLDLSKATLSFDLVVLANAASFCPFTLCSTFKRIFSLLTAAPVKTLVFVIYKVVLQLPC